MRKILLIGSFLSVFWCQIFVNASLYSDPFLQKLRAEERWAELVLQLKPVTSSKKKWTAEDLIYLEALMNLGRRNDAMNVIKAKIPFGSLNEKKQLMDRLEIVSTTFLTRDAYQAYRNALNKLKAARYDEAQDRLESLLGREPHNIQVLTDLAFCRIQLRQIDLAIETLKTVKHLNPYHQTAGVFLGRSYYLKGDLQRSRQEYAALDWEKQVFSAYAAAWYAELLYSQLEFKKAITVLEKDLDRNPEHLPSLIMKAQLYFSEATSELRELWKARAELQLAQSRYEKFQKIHPYAAQRLKPKMNQLMNAIEKSIALLQGKSKS